LRANRIYCSLVASSEFGKYDAVKIDSWSSVLGTIHHLVFFQSSITKSATTWNFAIINFVSVYNLQLIFYNRITISPKQSARTFSA
jgi:hypothetical protein